MTSSEEFWHLSGICRTDHIFIGSDFGGEEIYTEV